ncbi:MAG: hypothetical protein Q9213_005485 [Squamulea squamosa]
MDTVDKEVDDDDELPPPLPPKLSERQSNPEQDEADASVREESTDDASLVVGDVLDEPPNPTERQSSPEQDEVGLALPETLLPKVVVEVSDCEIVAGIDEVVVEPSKFSEALTQSRFVHPYGRVDVEVLEAAEVAVGINDVRGPAAEVELESELREALTQRRFVQPKGKLVEGMGVEVFGPEDTEVGVTEMLRQRRPVQPVVEVPVPVIIDSKVVEPEVNGKVRAPLPEVPWPDDVPVDD